jgi:carbamoyltransferase
LNILGVSALYHDSAAVLLRDGDIIAAAQEERFTRVKGDSRVPRSAISYVLREGGVKPGEIDLLLYFEKPLTKLTRLLSTYGQVAPKGLKSFMMAMPVWLKEKAHVPLLLEQVLVELGYGKPKAIQLAEHHLSHAASAFYPSPFHEAAILTVDGVGEWTTTAIAVGEGNSLKQIYEQRFPHSLGMLYSAFTQFTGFKVNSGEYKLMGLAPYGDPVYADLIKEHIVTVREDGSFFLNMDYFDFLGGLSMCSPKFGDLFGGPARTSDQPITAREMDLARSIQAVTEEIMLKMARYARAVTGKPNLVMAGGVALNCVANGRIWRSGIFDNMWIQPAAGDAGGALGAALYSWFNVLGNERVSDNTNDRMHGSLLGPGFSSEQVKAWLDQNKLPYTQMDDVERPKYLADRLNSDKVIGVFQGRMEYGPRALCNRSIMADARSVKMQSYLNLATKFRESFRPFAPIVLVEDAPEYFEEIHDSPYMLLVDQVRPERLKKGSGRQKDTQIHEWVNTPRSDVPAITHVDYSARVQTVDRGRNPRAHDILTAFKELTGYGILVNTSFNVRSEPIVCTPEDAYVCFMRTGIDVLVLEDFVLDKTEQPAWQEEGDWRDQYVPD